MTTKEQRNVVAHRQPRFIIEEETTRRWIVYDRQGLVGGLFIDRPSALRFVKSICASRPTATYCFSRNGRLRTDLIFGKRSSLLKIV
ncbi:hypothetical protein WH297_06455 [Ochrobactrum vermis]|uniref:Uncharacterized protein n=1 Tax=Ochrobactrum vermis TaxID=1827297 RepID=A0ABU8PAZ3_9HYPH|nr:hypothetical protein [Ochrobactrum vermis]PQZ29856.1 hypothetical protein CQZ93_06595 [Ochrobactrum vermis]